MQYGDLTLGQLARNLNGFSLRVRLANGTLTEDKSVAEAFDLLAEMALAGDNLRVFDTGHVAEYLPNAEVLRLNMPENSECMAMLTENEDHARQTLIRWEDEFGREDD